MPISQEENDKIQEDLEQQIEEQTPIEDPVKEKPGEGEPAIEDDETPKPYWAEKGFDSEESFVKSYDSAQSMIGKQATEIGDLRKTTEDPVKEKPEVEFDPYDEGNLNGHIEKRVHDAIEAQKKADNAHDAEIKTEADRLSMIGKFVESHKSLSKTELETVAQFAVDNGIKQLEHAWTIMDNNKPQAEAQKASGRGKNINDLPTTIADVGSGGKKEKKYSEASRQEWSSLSASEREDALRNA